MTIEEDWWVDRKGLEWSFVSGSQLGNEGEGNWAQSSCFDGKVHKKKKKVAAAHATNVGFVK